MEFVLVGMGFVAGVVFSSLMGINKPIDCKVVDNSKILDCSDMSDEDMETIRFIKEGFKR